MENRQGNNEDLENFYLSYIFYRNYIKRLHGSMQDKNCSEEILLAAKNLELIFNYCEVRDFNLNFKNLAEHYNASVKFDWSQIFSYFDLLDALILHKYAESVLSSYCEIINTIGNDVAYPYFHFVTNIARPKLPKLAKRIVIEHYRDSKSQALKESAQFYFNAARTLSLKLSEKYGSALVPLLDAIWTASYLHRINSMEQLKSAQADFINRSGLPAYNPDIQEFFCLSELIGSWCQYQDRPEFGDQICFTDPQHYQRTIDYVSKEYDLKIDEDICQLYCFLVSNFIIGIEYLALQFYAVTGERTDLAGRYRDSAQYFQTKAFANDHSMQD